MLHAPFKKFTRFKPVLQRQRQHANRRADGVSPADPIPERKRVLRMMPNSLTNFKLVDTAT